MKNYLLSISTALIILVGALASEARAQDAIGDQNETRNGQVAEQQPETQPQAPSDAQASAGPVCGKRSLFVSRLKDRYEEKPVSVGLASNGVIIEVFAALSGSFSIIVTRPEGVSCLVTSGSNWQDMPTQKAEISI